MVASIEMCMMLISMFVFNYFDLAMCFATVITLNTAKS